MEKLVNKSYLDINSLLIKWSLLKGYLKDGQIQITKFGLFNLWFCFIYSFIGAIKYFVQLFIPKDSKIANQLGDWGYFLGPKIVINFMCLLILLYIIFAKILFLIASNNSKMFYWIDVMGYTEENQSFDKLKLNATDSKKFIKRLSLSVYLLKCFTNTFITSFYTIIPILIFQHQESYHINYFISILFFLPESYYAVTFMFGFLGILYSVSELHLKKSFTMIKMIYNDLDLLLF